MALKVLWSSRLAADLIKPARRRPLRVVALPGRRGEAFQQFPFHTLANVVASPHRSNQVFGWEEASLDDVTETLDALLRGEQRNRVDPARGY